MAKLLTILCIQILCGMEMDLFIPSFPELQQVFSLTPLMVQLTLSVNFVAFCISSLFAGALGDRFNRRTILLLGLMIFVIGSLCCVLAPNFSCLVFGRFLQGVGISAPAILSFPVILEAYASDQQAGIMGMINGVKTLAMAIAPVIGSFVNLYFNWRGNFTVLLILGLVCLIASCITIPSKESDKSVSLSLQAYVPLLKSLPFLKLAFALSLLTGAYWLFLAMAPILYMEAMDVPLKYFGYYQGALSLTFAMVCILSSKLCKRYRQSDLLFGGIVICVISAVLILSLSALQINQPVIITAALILLSIGIVFPINILYPLLLIVLPNTKGRAAGLGQSILLLLTACLLEFVSYLYNGQFMSIGIAMFFAIIMATALMLSVIRSKQDKLHS